MLEQYAEQLFQQLFERHHGKHERHNRRERRSHQARARQGAAPEDRAPAQERGCSGFEAGMGRLWPWIGHGDTLGHARGTATVPEGPRGRAGGHVRLGPRTGRLAWCEARIT